MTRRWSNSTDSTRPRAFTLLQLLIVIAVVIILLAILIPSIAALRESNRRAHCADKLRQIGTALATYSADNHREYPRVRDDAENPDGYVAYTGASDPDPFAEESRVQPNDVTASLWLLVRAGYVPDPVVFICPGVPATRDRAEPGPRANFRSPDNLSYSYASPFSSAENYRLGPDALQIDFALLADMNPGTAPPADDVTAPNPDSPPDELRRANSNNHGKVGQNVLFADGSVRFESTVFCGVGRDNIYTAQPRAQVTDAAGLLAPPGGLLGPNVGPAGPDDSYLVPTASDVAPIVVTPAGG